MQHHNPLHILHQQTTAEFQPYADVEIVSTFGNTPAEYSSIHKGSGKMDLPQRGILELTGRDRLDFLNRMLTNSVKGLKPGQGVYAFLLNLKGRIVADMNVLELQDRTWLEMDARLVEVTSDALKKYVVLEDLTLTNRTGEIHTIGLFGPRVADELVLPQLGQLDSGHFAFAEIETIVWRDDRCGSPGYYLSFPSEHATKIWTTLTNRPIGWAAFNAVRIEFGRPMMGIDFDDTVLPAELGATTLNRAVSFTKGCYLGQEIVARLHARGQVARQLVGIRMETDALPVAGSPIFDNAGNTIGGVTSSTVSPILSNAAICLGIVKKQFIEAGTDLTIPAEGANCRGKVTELPFVK
jgi:folate-binding protein YgfZ